MPLEVSIPPIEPSATWKTVTPSDTTTYTGIRRVYVGGAGNLAIVDAFGNAVTLTAVPVGTVLQISPTIIKATGTTATNIVALF